MQPAGVGAERGRRMDRGQRQPRVVEPFGELLDRGRIPVVEVRSQREQLDGVEAVRSDVDEVLPIEPVRVEQVGETANGVPDTHRIARPRRSNTACRAGHHASLRCSSLTAATAAACDPRAELGNRHRQAAATSSSSTSPGEPGEAGSPAIVRFTWDSVRGMYCM